MGGRIRGSVFPVYSGKPRDPHQSRGGDPPGRNRCGGDGTLCVVRCLSLADVRRVRSDRRRLDRISLGRDIRVRGRSPSGDPWRLGLEHPDQPDRCWGGVAIEDAALCCSGDYRRYFEAAGRRYGHIVDPRTGRPADRGCRAAWVIAPTCVEAGILSTVSLVLGPDEGVALIEASRHAAGCFWTDRGMIPMRRFAKYELPEEMASV